MPACSLHRLEYPRSRLASILCLAMNGAWPPPKIWRVLQITGAQFYRKKKLTVIVIVNTGIDSSSSRVSPELQNCESCLWGKGKNTYKHITQNLSNYCPTTWLCRTVIELTHTDEINNLQAPSYSAIIQCACNS